MLIVKISKESLIRIFEAEQVDVRYHEKLREVSFLRPPSDGCPTIVDTYNLEKLETVEVLNNAGVVIHWA